MKSRDLRMLMKRVCILLAVAFSSIAFCEDEFKKAIYQACQQNKIDCNSFGFDKSSIIEETKGEWGDRVGRNANSSKAQLANPQLVAVKSGGIKYVVLIFAAQPIRRIDGAKFRNRNRNEIPYLIYDIDKDRPVFRCGGWANDFRGIFFHFNIGLSIGAS